MLLLLKHCLYAKGTNSRIIHVSKLGSDSNNGTSKAPLLTIGKAASEMRAGDKIVVHTCIYRESVILQQGGIADNSRISLVAGEGENVSVRGAEQIKSWKRLAGDICL